MPDTVGRFAEPERSNPPPSGIIKRGLNGANSRFYGWCFPIVAGILLGLGLGGFFDGIVLHQALQWHHMLSSWYPIKDVPGLEHRTGLKPLDLSGSCHPLTAAAVLNTLWDGIFHSITYVFVVVGMFMLWRVAYLQRLLWSNKLMCGTLLLGWGIFNVVEGIVDHEVLCVDHVNELVPIDQRIYWDIAFLAWGAAMFGRLCAFCDLANMKR